MKTKVAPFLMLAVAVFAAFLGGRLYQHLQNGYTLKQTSRKDIEFALGKLTHIQAFESIGAGIMTPSSAILEFESRTIFKAAPFFQESIPVLLNLEIHNNEIRWKDGEFDYFLTIDKRGK